jgi:hypothetical protein
MKKILLDIVLLGAPIYFDKNFLPGMETEMAQNFSNLGVCQRAFKK